MIHFSQVHYKDVILLAMIVIAGLTTLFFNDYSVWNVIPKCEVVGLTAFTLDMSMNAFNVVLVMLLMTLLWIYLDLRQRSTDKFLNSVYEVTKDTNIALQEAKLDKSRILEQCLEMLDRNSEQYDQILLLEQEWSNHGKVTESSIIRRLTDQKPPCIEESDSALSAF